MTLGIDRKAGRKQLRKTGVGDEAGKSNVPGPAEPSRELRVRMLRDLNCKLGVFTRGKSYSVPTDTARSWIGFGFAEQDKALDAAPEVK